MALLRLYRLTVLSPDSSTHRQEIRALPDEDAARQWAKTVLQRQSIRTTAVFVHLERSEEGRWVQVLTDAH
jgi:hypothetical protein